MIPLDTVPLWAGQAFSVAPGPVLVASPMHRGVDADAAVVSSGGRSWLVKAYHPEMLAAPGIDLTTAAQASRQAGEAGVAPALCHADVAAGLLVFDYLAPPWREARLDALAEPQTLSMILVATRRFHATAPLGRPLDPFAALRAEHAAVTGGLPGDTAWLLDQAAEIEAAIIAAGRDSVPCRGTGLASDVMLGPSSVMLLDFDHAGDGDPYYDLGILLTEAFAFEPPMRQAVEQWAGRCDEALLARCQLYGIVDDLLWGIRMLRLAQVSPRTGVEFFKYGEWRLLRARMNLRRWSFEAKLRSL